ncbi:MAG: TIGR03067 domain-containing protein [Planctomycetota bacterium]|nr:TIGR03067 domain-containing protein [Planctomycetota bacterium]
MLKLRIVMGMMVGLLVGGMGLTQETTKKADSPDGSWKLTKGEADGKALTAEQLKGGKLVIKDDKYKLTMGEMEVIEGTEKLDPSKDPKTIDIVNSNGPDKGKTFLGIYNLKGDRFRVVFSQPGKPRPTKFKTEPDSGQWLHVWTRTKE